MGGGVESILQLLLEIEKANADHQAQLRDSANAGKSLAYGILTYGQYSLTL